MLKHPINGILATALVAAALSVTNVAKARADTGAAVPAGPTGQPTPAAMPTLVKAPQGGAAIAMAQAAHANKYLFLFFYRAQDEPTQAARKTFDAAMAKLADRATSAVVNVTDQQEQTLVVKYRLNRAPMPFVLVVAPNGAVVRGYRSAFSEAQLMSSFASPGQEAALKSLQDGKMTFLCVQNADTAHDAEAMKGVNEFKSDSKYAATTEVITIDPADAAEAEFLRNLGVDPKTPEAVTVLLAPPGKPVGTFKGATDKTVLLASVQSATKPKACCPGKKGGCGPKAKKN